MDSAIYNRIKTWGTLMQEYRNRTDTSECERLLLDLRTSRDGEFKRVMQVLYALSQTDDALTTSDLAEVLCINIQSMTQIIRALREGGFHLDTCRQGCQKAYGRVNVPAGSVLEELLQEFI